MDSSIAHSFNDEKVEHSFYGASLAVLQIAETSLTPSQAEKVSIATETCIPELRQHYVPSNRRPPSRNSVLGAVESTLSYNMSAHTHPVIRPRPLSLRLEVPEPAHTVYTPVHPRLSVDSSTHLPSYCSPTLSGKRPSNLSFVRNRTWASFKTHISCISFEYLRKLYHIVFLGFPVFYRNRVHRIFKEVWLSKDDVMEHIIATLAEEQARLEARGQPLSSAAYFVRAEDTELSNLKTLWESFVDQSLKEWKMTNFVSILLPSTIIGTLQISEAISDVVVRTSILMSLVCALMSLMYGCLYTVRFSTMRRVHKAFQWAKEGERTRDHIFWNTWVLLSMPVTWLTWSLIFYTVGITSFIWRAGSGRPIPTVEMGLTSRIAITCLLWIGVVYFVLIILTLNEYGDRMDVTWREKVRQVAAERNIVLEGSFDGHAS